MHWYQLIRVWELLLLPPRVINTRTSEWEIGMVSVMGILYHSSIRILTSDADRREVVSRVYVVYRERSVRKRRRALDEKRKVAPQLARRERACPIAESSDRFSFSAPLCARSSILRYSIFNACPALLPPCISLLPPKLLKGMNYGL